MTILPWLAKLNTREFEKIRHSRNFVPAKLNTFKVVKSSVIVFFGYLSAHVTRSNYWLLIIFLKFFLPGKVGLNKLICYSLPVDRKHHGYVQSHYKLWLYFKVESKNKKRCLFLPASRKIFYRYIMFWTNDLYIWFFIWMIFLHSIENINTK